jgi:hypothetical protein
MLTKIVLLHGQKVLLREKNSSPFRILTEFDTELVLRFYQFSHFNQIKENQFDTATEILSSSARIFLKGVGNTVSHPMRLKARGLVQHGGPSGWLEESDRAGVIWM